MDMEHLYKENYRIVYGYILSLCAVPTLAEDLTSETFLRRIQNLHKFREEKISTWLCTIGRNLFLNERKKQRKLVPLDEMQYASVESFEKEVEDRDQAQQIS